MLPKQFLRCERPAMKWSATTVEARVAGNSETSRIYNPISVAVWEVRDVMTWELDLSRLINIVLEVCPMRKEVAAIGEQRNRRNVLIVP